MASPFLKLILIVLLLPWNASAGEFQFYGGANSTTYDEVSEADTWGVSLRAQYNFGGAESGWFANIFAPGQSLFASELSGGYLWKSSGDLYFEGGLGGGYSRIWGPLPVLIAGMGYRVSQTVYFDFPIMYSSALVFMPYIGISF